MQKPILVIGNKKYSSWSLRPWLFLKASGIDFDEVRIPLLQADTQARLAPWSPTLKVPVLRHGELTVWDSLAICEYASEHWLAGKGWPGESAQRARARSVAAEMHSGFQGLRSEWPMNVCYSKQQPVTAAISKDLARIESLWQECLQRSGGPFLFGDFSIADAMFAPVVLRFASYQPPVQARSRDYMQAVLALPSLQAWITAGKAESEVIDEDEYDWLQARR